VFRERGIHVPTPQMTLVERPSAAREKPGAGDASGDPAGA
jgi:hypothetical protein